jgi:dolichyl-phosphate beta-glucosyltransferase
MDLSVVVPAYNEERRIGPTLARIVAYLADRPGSAEVVVVIDGSRDGTAAVVRQVQSEANRDVPVHLLDHVVNTGKGASVRRGMLAARGDLRLFSDADLSTPIEEVDRLVAAVRAGADVAIGSRRLPDSRIGVRQPWPRRAMGGLFSWCARSLVVPGIRDTQCGFKLFTAHATRRLFPRQRIDEFGFDVELLWIARRLGLRVAEVAVTWHDDPRSTVRPVSDAARMLRDLVRIRLADRRGVYAGAAGDSPNGA